MANDLQPAPPPHAAPPKPPAPSLAVDPQKPWLGLTSYSEETRDYFFGREEETAELSRRVQRKLLTVLFSQSGLGKTSLLRAGLVPALRPMGYCPIYVRVNYGGQGAAPAEQVKLAAARATAAAGAWTNPAPPDADESLWEFFHHRDDILQDSEGRTLTPLLIFDQFEEVFTLAQTDDAGRNRARAFLEQLADLVENRPPVELEEDETAVERYDFARADYRVLISLREDYLANLENLKSLMPSITQNRLSLALMSGFQAIQAVVKPGAGLVSESVAEQVVKFVAGSDEMENVQVEPSLLSLVCRELNEARLLQGHDVITADLLAGSRKTILSEFYDRTLSDQPDGVRRYIEDVLLTDSGYRESIAEERVQAAFAKAGAPSALNKLVDRRLLRIEERVDLRRVELTHDVLCGVVKASRDVRAERLALAAARKRALRQRWIIGGLAVILIALAFGAFQNRRSRSEQLAQASRTDFILGSNLIDADKVADGLAYLVRAARTSPANELVAPRLISTLAYRNFPLAKGPELEHPESVAMHGIYGEGERLVTVASDFSSAYVWNARSRDQLLAPIDLAPDPLRALEVATSPDGGFLAVVRSDRSIAVWDLATGAERYPPITYESASGQVNLAFSPDSNWLVSYGDDGKARVWDARTGAAKVTINASTWISSVAFSRDLTRIVTTMIDASGWRVWSFPDGAPLTAPMPAASQGNRARFSPDGKRVIVSDNRGAQVWDWAKGERMGPRLEHDDRSDYVQFFPDGQWALTTSADRTLRIWSASSGLLINKIPLPGIAWSVAIAPDSTRLLVRTTDGTARVWDAYTGKALSEPIRAGHLNTAHFGPDGNEIWTAGRDGLVRRWSLGQGAAQPLRIKGLVNHLSSTQSVVDYRIQGTVAQKFDLRTGRTVGDPITLPEAPTAAWLSPRGRYLIAATADGRSHLWDLDARPVTGFPLENPWFSRGAWPTVAFDEEESWIALERIQSLNQGSSLVVRSLPEGTLRFEPIGPLFGFVLPIPSPDGKLVAAGMFNGVARIWNAETGAQHGIDMIMDTQINTAAFSPDGKLLITAGNGGAWRAWEVDTGEPATERLLHGIRVNGAQFARGGRRLLTTDWESAQVWDLKEFAPAAPAMKGNATLASAIFDNEARRVYGVMIDGATRIWDARTGLKIVESLATDGPVPYIYGMQAMSDANLLRVNTGYSSATLFAIPDSGRGAPAPNWLLDLASLLAGQTIDESGAFEPLNIPSVDARFEEIATTLDSQPDDKPFVSWGRWFLAPRPNRSIAPGLSITAAEAEALAGP